MALATLISCESAEVSEQDLCEGLSHFSLRLENATLVLKPWQESRDGGRMPASSESTPHEMNLRERKAWESWAEKELFTSQRALDQIKTVRGQSSDWYRDFSDLPTSLVVFHAHAASGNIKKMMAELDKMSAQSQAAYLKRCK